MQCKNYDLFFPDTTLRATFQSVTLHVSQKRIVYFINKPGISFASER